MEQVKKSLGKAEVVSSILTGSTIFSVGYGRGRRPTVRFASVATNSAAPRKAIAHPLDGAAAHRALARDTGTIPVEGNPRCCF